MALSILPVSGYRYINIEKLQSGDPEHFRKLYTLYYDDLFVEAYLLLTKKEEAATIVQHSFIKCWLRSQGITSIEYFAGYLRTSIHRGCQLSNHQHSDSLHSEELLKNIMALNSCEQIYCDDVVHEFAALSDEQKNILRDVFGQWYRRRRTIHELSLTFGLTLEETQHMINLSYQVLHIILYNEN